MERLTSRVFERSHERDHHMPAKHTCKVCPAPILSDVEILERVKAGPTDTNTNVQAFGYCCEACYRIGELILDQHALSAGWVR